MRSSFLFPILCCPLASVLAACSTETGERQEAEVAEAAQTSCEAGIALPDVAVQGYVVTTPVAPKKNLGLVVGPLPERAPIEIDPPTLVSFADDDPRGLVRKGWTITAKRGERFSFGSFNSQGVSFTAYGPIDGCKAAATDAPAQFEGINGWRAPANGTYFVTPSHSLYRETSGVIHPYPDPQASYPGMLAVRRLLADDTPAGHAFVESAPLPLYGASAVAVRTLAGESSPTLLVIGTRLPATNGGPAEKPSLVVVRRGAEPTYIAECAPGLGGIVTADFDGDGRTDVLAGTNLFLGRPDGGFACEPSGLTAWGAAPVGALDIDGDGMLDLVDVSFNGGGSSTTTTVWVTPYFRRGAAFVAGAIRRLDVPFGTTFDGTRTAFLDVTGDGKPEIVAAMIDPAASTPTNRVDTVLAFEVPPVAPADAAPPPPGSAALPLVRAAAVPSLTPHPDEVGNRGPRYFDADGDGVRDRVLLQTWYSYSGFGIAYGKPAGGFELAWDVPSTNNFGSRPIVEHFDYDGDGCEDVVVAGYGLRLFRGVRCAH